MVEISAVSSNELCEWLISQSNGCYNMRFDYIVLFCFVFSVYLVFHLPLQGQVLHHGSDVKIVRENLREFASLGRL